MSHYPKHSELFIGEVFERVPEQVYWHKAQGSYPIYGREIVNIERVGKHKVVVELGFVDDTASQEATIHLYGEIDELLTIYL